MSPVRAGMVANPQGYRWSSYHCNALGVASKLWTPHPQYLALAGDAVARRIAYRGLFSEQLTASAVREIRSCLYQGTALGDSQFRNCWSSQLRPSPGESSGPDPPASGFNGITG